MAKKTTQYACQSCGAVYAKWSGRCESCSEWNTIVEENAAGGVGGRPGKPAPRGRVIPLLPLRGETESPPRIASGMSEVDRVLGGGIVRGSAALIGGEPGIGKSTLLIQTCASVARAGHRVVYISGEEAVDQVRMRAARLGLDDADVALASETSVEDIVRTLEDGPTPALVIIDSIQTVWTASVESPPGTVAQVRTAGQDLIRYAKRSGAALVLVGHVTKEGSIAGPRVIEHMVDAVIYFEGDGAHRYRILRAVKNRFGPTDEIGVFEMTGKGLSEVANPSALFLGDRKGSSPGTAVFAGMEGSRPILVEIQALVAPSTLGTPRRAVVGWDQQRLAMVIAVLETHCGVRLGAHDVYLNVAGGMRVQDPAADLAVAAALTSSLSGHPVGVDEVHFGEISLSGAVRPVAHSASRVKEAGKLGFTSAVAPTPGPKDPRDPAVSVAGVDTLAQMVAMVVAKGKGKAA